MQEYNSTNRCAGTGYVFATATTKWHALGVEIWATKLNKAVGQLEGVVLLRCHPVSGYMLSSKDLSWVQGTKINLVRYSDRRSVIRNLRLLVSLPILAVLLLRTKVFKSRNPVYVAAPFLTPWTAIIDIIGLSLLVHRGVQVYRIDEGFSSYLPDSFWSRKRARENFSSAGHPIPRLMRRKLDDIEKWLYGRLDNALLKENRCLFEINDTQGTLIPRESIILEYARSIRRSGQSKFSKNSISRIAFSPIALVVTQPWSEGRELAAEKEMELLKRLCLFLFSTGFNICLKTHPREKPGKYKPLLSAICSKKITVVETTTLAEAIFRELTSRDVVVGFFSTALLNAKLFYQLRAFSVPEAWMSEVNAPADLVETQRLFRRYTRLLLKDISALQHPG